MTRAKKHKALTEFYTSLPKETEPTLRIVPMPSDTNHSGDVFGGWIMSQVDIAGSMAAIRRSGGHVVTVAVNNFVFKHPVYVGDLVSFYTKVTKVGYTSITVDVIVYAQRGSREGNEEVCIKVTEALLTYVAVDEKRRPQRIGD